MTVQSPSRDMTLDTKPHDWSFFRASGFDQVRLTCGADIAALASLDQKLWTALACPATGLEFPTETLAHIDGNGDGRIRAAEILDTIAWLSTRLTDLDLLVEPGDTVPLDRLDRSTAEGERAHASAKQILANLGNADAPAISAADAGDTVRIFADTHFNGDGVIPAAAAEDDAVSAVIDDILACSTPAVDRSGAPGITTDLVVAFFDAAQAYVDWRAQVEQDPSLMPLGDATAAARDAVDAVAAKVEDFFARCRLANFDPRAVEALNREESAYLDLAAKDLSITPDEVAELPLARVEAGASLPLGPGVNPAWSAAISTFASAAVRPLVGDVAELTASDWNEVQGRLAAYRDWQAAKAGEAVEGLGLERVRAILASDARAAIEGLLEQDLALADEAQGIDDVTKLVLLRRDFFQLLENFVSFRDFYTPGRRAIFQAGTLYLDERSCDLCIRVSDMAAHGIGAPMSRAYVAYCACTRKSTGDEMTIAAAFTGGDTDFLVVGRNGVFYDRDGNDWDAKIVKIVEAPLSIPQAFWAPYKRLLRWIEDTVAKRAAAADNASQARLVSGTEGAMAQVESGATAPEAKAVPEKPKIDVGMVAAFGVAVGGMVAALGLVLEVFFGLGMWMPVGILGLLLVISGPSMLIAWLKLRQRNLGPLLNANGWAVNQQARINIPFGSSLTGVARIPATAHRDLADPYAASTLRRTLVLVALLIVGLAGLWFLGSFDAVLPASLDRAIGS